MINMIIAGVWGAIVAVGAAYGVVLYQEMPASASAHGAETHMEQVKTKLITIPVISDGVVVGYSRVQLAFGVEKSELLKLPIKPDIILIDEAHRSLADLRFADPRKPSRTEISSFLDSLKNSLNTRVGNNLIKEVLLQDYSYIDAKSIRDKSVK